MRAPKWTPGPWAYRPNESAHDTQRIVHCLVGPAKAIWKGHGVAYVGTYAKSIATDPRGGAARLGIRLSDKECEANARLIAAAPDLARAAQLQEDAEDAHANCPECEGEGVPELCPKCFPLFDDARLARRNALALARGEQS